MASVPLRRAPSVSAVSVAASPEIIAQRQACDQRLSELRLDRATYEEEWHHIARMIVPHRGRFLPPLAPRRPRQSGQKIIDPTATKAHQRLSAFLQAGITNPALDWFRLGVAADDIADDPNVKAYLSEVQRRMFRVLNSGTFYNSLHQVYEENAGFGTGCMIAMRDFEDVVRFYPLTVGEYYLALDDRQEIDTLYREYSLPVAAVVKKYGYAQCSTTVQSMYDARRYSGLVVIIHAIEPNRDMQPGKAGWRGKPWISFEYERGISDRFLRQEGFGYKPFIAPRWSALAGDAYGQGPGHWSLPDVRSLQTGARQMAEAAEKLVNPPMQADSTLQQAYLGILPGDINWISGLMGNPNAGIKPVFEVSPNVQVLQAEVQQFRETIKETFFNDLILAISQMDGVQPRNEMEIAERKGEKMLMLGPMLERFYNEALAPVIRIVFHIMQEGHLLPPPPPVLHGRAIEPAFISALAQAQKAVGTSSLEQFVRFIGTMAGAWPDITQVLDDQAVATEYAADLEINPKLLRSAEQVEAIRANAAKQAQLQQLLQATPALAQAGKTISGIAPGAAGQAIGQQSGAVQ